MRKLLIALLLFALAGAAEARVKRTMCCTYSTRDGQSDPYKLSVDFMAGFELAKVTKDFSYDFVSVYACIWIKDGEVAIVKLKDPITVGAEVKNENMSTLETWAKINAPLTPYLTGPDKRGVIWRVYFIKDNKKFLIE